jgi:hypothetical protein
MYLLYLAICFLLSLLYTVYENVFFQSNCRPVLIMKLDLVDISELIFGLKYGHKVLKFEFLILKGKEVINFRKGKSLLRNTLFPRSCSVEKCTVLG